MSHSPDLVDVHVGRRVCALRRSQGLSQTQLAKAIGVSFQQVQKYERGDNRISASMLFKIATMLRQPISALFEGLGPQKPAHPDAAMQSSVAVVDALLSVSGGLELAKAFPAVDPAMRRPLVALIQGLAASAEHN